MTVQEFIRRAEAWGKELRAEGRNDEARTMLAHKAGFKVVCEFVGKDIATTSLDEFMALRGDARLKGEKRLRARFNSAVYMIRKHLEHLEGPTKPSALTVADTMQKIDRLRPLFGKRRYRKRSYKTVVRILNEAAEELRKLVLWGENRGEDVSGWTLPLLQANANGRRRKGFDKIRRAMGMLSGELDDAGMPLLDPPPGSEDKRVSPKPASKPVPVTEPGPKPKPPTKQPPVPAPPPGPLDETPPGKTQLKDLPFFNPALSLEDNCRYLARAYAEADARRARAQAKVDGLVDVIKNLSDLVR